MIPKIIHYAWFGSEIPAEVLRRIDQWKEVLPDWRFLEWNESNWDVEKDEFTKRAFHEKKLGYIADVLRYDVVYRYGGFYLDTDMIIKKDLTDFCDYQNVFGFMYDNNLHTGMFGAEKHSNLILKLQKLYMGEIYPDIFELTRSWNNTSNIIVTLFFKKHFLDFHLNGHCQLLSHSKNERVLILPKDYLVYPSYNSNGNYAQHLFTNSWNDGLAYKSVRGRLKIIIKKCFGEVFFGKISSRHGITTTNKQLRKYEAIIGEKNE
ncbi:glycosyltransferase family 32 protein [Leuconostoc mesenteroides]|uniref:glycosyltransferase family 32 protein n=1 Tax=Leuconostoc mesenteroides TaxID=1245 RepID=UPI000A0268C1|nr:glycosyltransferase [Leuconostoc mesenteroides]ORI93346.1 hypothetical protein BMS99_07420 [Leuconostoc mesenteroides subsp. mesenteroides]RDF93157.1 glycosyl transferase [Leuconostoc mesenteroides subsp. mesenteroides]